MSNTSDSTSSRRLLRPVPNGAWGDYVTRDDRWLVQVKQGIHSVRDLAALTVEMARGIASAPVSRRACLALVDPRMSRERLGEEWRTLRGILHPSLGKRMALLVLQGGERWSIPDEAPILAIGEALPRTGSSGPSTTKSDHRAPSRKSFEILKVLVHHWLLRRAPVAISELMRISGCSYPTVAEALRGWQRRDELIRHSNRRVSLRAFPNEAWGEAVALSQAFRRPMVFGTRSDRPLDLQDLLRRLERARLPGVALGGVVAARHWDPRFDLHGLPRIDLCVHAPSGDVRPDLLCPLDPALLPVQEPRGSARIVVHPLRRPESLFVEHKGFKVHVADPVETLLDLHELHLTEQTTELARRLAAEGGR